MHLICTKKVLMSDAGQCMSYLATSIASAPSTSRFASSGHPCVLLLNTDQSREGGGKALRLHVKWTVVLAAETPLCSYFVP